MPTTVKKGRKPQNQAKHTKNGSKTVDSRTKVFSVVSVCAICLYDYPTLKKINYFQFLTSTTTLKGHPEKPSTDYCLPTWNFVKPYFYSKISCTDKFIHRKFPLAFIPLFSHHYSICVPFSLSNAMKHRSCSPSI